MVSETQSHQPLPISGHRSLVSHIKKLSNFGIILPKRIECGLLY